jgi:hypothetical protein
MSYKDFQEAERLIDSKYVNLDYVYPQPRERVTEAKNILNVSFPKSYEEFLYRFGSIGFSGEEIYGLNKSYDYSKYVYCNVVCATIEERKVNKDPIFPNYLIPIHALGNGELSCLDISQMNEEGECPVIAWYFGATLPNGKLEVLAKDFGAFLLEKLLAAH